MILNEEVVKIPFSNDQTQIETDVVTAADHEMVCKGMLQIRN